MTKTDAGNSGKVMEVGARSSTGRAAGYAAGYAAKVTLHIRRLLATQLRWFRLEMVDRDHPALPRVGALLIFGPVLLVGYAFVLASLVRYLAIRIGWGVGLLLVGLIHLALGAWGWRRSRGIAFTQSYEVMAPDCEPQRSPDPSVFDNAVTLPALRTPVRPGRRAGGVYNPA